MNDTELDAIRGRLARNGVLGVTDAVRLLAEVTRLRKAAAPVVTVVEGSIDYWRPAAVTTGSGTPAWTP